MSDLNEKMQQFSVFTFYWPGLTVPFKVFYISEKLKIEEMFSCVYGKSRLGGFQPSLPRFQSSISVSACFSIYKPPEQALSKHQTKKPHARSDRRVNMNPYQVTDLK